MGGVAWSMSGIGRDNIGLPYIHTTITFYTSYIYIYIYIYCRLGVVCVVCVVCMQIKAVYLLVHSCPSLRCVSALVMHPRSHSMTRGVAKWT